MRLIGLCALSFIYAAPAWSQDAPLAGPFNIYSKTHYNDLVLNQNRGNNEASLYAKNRGDNQLFYIQPLKNGNVKIMSVSGQMCLRAIDDGSTRILDFTQCANNKNQEFKLELINQDDNTVTISFTNDQGKRKCLDVYQENLGTWDCHDGDNQQFILERAIPNSNGRHLQKSNTLVMFEEELIDVLAEEGAGGAAALIAVLNIQLIANLSELLDAYRAGQKQVFIEKLLCPRFMFKQMYGSECWQNPTVIHSIYKWTDRIFDHHHSQAKLGEKKTCQQDEGTVLLKTWIKAGFPLDPKADYQRIKWIYDYLSVWYPKLTPSMHDMQSDNPTKRIEAQSIAFLLLVEDQAKRSISEQDMKKLWGGKELREVSEALLKAIEDSLCMDKQSLKDFQLQVIKATRQQWQKNRQDFKKKYQVNVENAMPLFSLDEKSFKLVKKEKATNKILSDMTISRNSETFTLFMLGEKINLVLAIDKKSANEFSLRLMIDGQLIENTVAKYYPAINSYQISSVIDPFVKAVGMLMKMTEPGSPATPTQKRQEYNLVFEKAHRVKRALFCHPNNSRGRVLRGDCESNANEGGEEEDSADSRAEIEMQNNAHNNIDPQIDSSIINSDEQSDSSSSRGNPGTARSRSQNPMVQQRPAIAESNNIRHSYCERNRENINVGFAWIFTNMFTIGLLTSDYFNQSQHHTIAINALYVGLAFTIESIMMCNYAFDTVVGQQLDPVAALVLTPTISVMAMIIVNMYLYIHSHMPNSKNGS
jgi:ribosomal protein L19